MTALIAFPHLVLVLIVGLFVWVEPAQAYLDPGTGTMIIQGLVAAVVGAFVVLKTYWGVIKGFFTRLAGKGEQTPPHE
jgi:hypothetical protein